MPPPPPRVAPPPPQRVLGRRQRLAGDIPVHSTPLPLRTRSLAHTHIRSQPRAHKEDTSDEEVDASPFLRVRALPPRPTTLDDSLPSWPSPAPRHERLATRAESAVHHRAPSFCAWISVLIVVSLLFWFSSGRFPLTSRDPTGATTNVNALPEMPTATPLSLWPAHEVDLEHYEDFPEASSPPEVSLEAVTFPSLSQGADAAPTACSVSCVEPSAPFDEELALPKPLSEPLLTWTEVLSSLTLDSPRLTAGQVTHLGASLADPHVLMNKLEDAILPQLQERPWAWKGLCQAYLLAGGAHLPVLQTRVRVQISTDVHCDPSADTSLGGQAGQILALLPPRKERNYAYAIIGSMTSPSVPSGSDPSLLVTSGGYNLPPQGRVGIALSDLIRPRGVSVDLPASGWVDWRVITLVGGDFITVSQGQLHTTEANTFFLSAKGEAKTKLVWLVLNSQRGVRVGRVRVHGVL